MHKDATFKLRLPQEELAEWKQRAESESLSLAAWIRERCTEAPHQKTAGAVRQATKGRSTESTKRPVHPASVPSDTEISQQSHESVSPRHTAESNWHTCPCETCVQKRKAVA